ncbi:MAG: hypothetical protein CUN54_10780, partial [Phototrophicales bacterium]
VSDESNNDRLFNRVLLNLLRKFNYRKLVVALRKPPSPISSLPPALKSFERNLPTINNWHATNHKKSQLRYEQFLKHVIDHLKSPATQTFQSKSINQFIVTLASLLIIT